MPSNPRIDVTLRGATSAFASPSTVRGTAAVGQPILTTSSQSSAFPILASPNGQTAADMRTAVANGYNGIVYYFGGAPSWSSDLSGLATTHGTQPLNMMITAKGHTDAGLTQIFSSLPTAWKNGFNYSIYQEPEDNIYKSFNLTVANYKAMYASAGNAIRAWNTAHPTNTFGMTWMELQEDVLVNRPTWSQTALFPDNPADFDGILWSFFNYGPSGGNASASSVTTATIQSRINGITNFMATNCPGKQWGIMATAHTLEPASSTPNYSAADLTNQANWMKNCYAVAKASGAKYWGWYNKFFNSSPAGPADGESRVEVLPTLQAALDSLAR